MSPSQISHQQAILLLFFQFIEESAIKANETASAGKYKAEAFLDRVRNFFLHCVGFQHAHSPWLYPSPSTWQRSNLQSLFLPKCIFLVSKVKFNESIRSWSAHCFWSFFPLYKRANSWLTSMLILSDQNSSLRWPLESSGLWEFQRVYFKERKTHKGF